ncbi:MAG: FAD-dependent oxidoreductase, partial [Mesorhizobium sp.]
MADTTPGTMMEQLLAVEPAIVIGAGAAGLAVARALMKAGVATVVLEKESRLAEPWRRRHEQLHLNTHRDLSALPGLAYPKGTP